jgi:hypothetical protein
MHAGGHGAVSLTKPPPTSHRWKSASDKPKPAESREHRNNVTNPDPLKSYLADLQNKLSTGGVTEHTHRSTLEALLEALDSYVGRVSIPADF